MKKFLFSIILMFGITAFMHAQIIDIVGEGVHGTGAGAITLTDLSTIESVHVHATYKHPYIASSGPVEFSDFDDTFIAPFQPVTIKKFGTTSLGHKVGFFKSVFDDIDPTINLDVLTNAHEAVYAYYAFVYRDIDAEDRYSVINEDHVFMWHNGSAEPYVYNLPVDLSTGARDMTVKVVLAEINSNENRPNRQAIIDVDAGGVTAQLIVDDYHLGKFLSIVEIPLYGVPGSATNVSVSIYSPDPSKGEADGDSFIIGGVVVDVDKECGECDGKLTHLDLEYQGEGADSITVFSKKGKDNNLVETFYNVAKGDVLRLVGNDDKGTLGTEVRIFINDETLSTNIHTSCSQEILINMIFGEFRVDGGISLNGGPICETVPPDGDDCGDCEGQMTMLELQNNGADGDIKVIDHKQNVLFDGHVNAGEAFSFVGKENHGKMGPKVFVNGFEIHTSCSVDIYVGQTWGDYTILSGVSHEGGPLCDGDGDDTVDGQGDVEDCGCDKELTSLTLVNSGKKDLKDVEVYKDKKKKNLLYEKEILKKGDVFTLEGMGKKVYIFTKKDKKGKEIKTDCKKDTYIGKKYHGKYTIVKGMSDGDLPLCEKPDKKSSIANMGTGAEPLEMSVYPNPISNSGTVGFTVVNDVQTTVEMYNMMGSKVATLFNQPAKAGQEYKVNFDASKYIKGLYIIVIHNGTSTVKKKIIVN